MFSVSIRFALIGLVGLTLSSAQAEPSAWPIEKFLDGIYEEAGFEKGLAVVLGAQDSDIADELAGPDDFLVHLLEADPAAAATLQTNWKGDDRIGTRLLVEPWTGDRLPHTDNLIDLVLSTHLSSEGLSNLRFEDIVRVLRPGGLAVLGSRSGSDKPASAEDLRGWIPQGAESQCDIAEDDTGTFVWVRKPEPPGVDDWTHWEKAPDNNPVSHDQVIQAPYMTQFLGEPYYIAMPAISVVAGGRVFMAMGHIAHHKREEPWLNTLVAANGYNGTILWTRKLPDGYLVHRSAIIATDDAFYMIDPDGSGVLVLDPETGELQDRINPRRPRGEWKWIALVDGVLYALVGDDKDPAETLVLRSEIAHWSWNGLSKGYYEEEVPWGFGNTLLAFSLEDEELLWTHEEEHPIDSRSLAMGEGKLFYLVPEAHIVSLDTRSGEPIWTNADEETRKLIREPGVGLTSTPGFRTGCYALYTPEALFFEGQTLMNLVAVSNTDGKLLWSKEKTTSNPNMIYLDGDLLVGIGEEGNTLVIDPLSGEIEKDLGFRKRSCTRLTATPDSLFCRGFPEGLTRYDRNTKEIFFNGAMRPACNDGAIGANGLLYLGPWLCDCNLTLMGRNVLCSAGDFDFNPEVKNEDRLVKGTAPVSTDPAPTGPWSSYRGGVSRGSSLDIPIQGSNGRIWRNSPEVESEPTAPVVGGGKVFLGSRDGHIRCIDAVTGGTDWSYLTNGPVLVSPTYADGKVYAGSGDGHAYCLDAASGELVWRFRAAPVERRTMIYGSLASTWPVNTGVFVEGDVAFFGAGVIDYDGTFVYAVNADSGELVWCNDSSGHLDAKLRKGVSAQGTITVSAGKVFMPGGNVVSPAVYDAATGAYEGVPLADGSPRSNRGEELGLLGDDHLLLGGRLQFSARENVVDPGTFDSVPISDLGAKPLSLVKGKIPPTWNDRWFVFVNGRLTAPQAWNMGELQTYLGTRKAQDLPTPVWTSDALEGRDTVALALGRESVLAVCEKPVSNEIYSQWSLCWLDAATGALLGESPLPSAPLTGGLAIDEEGRIFLAMADGTLLCHGGAEAMDSYLAGVLNKAGEGQDGKEEAVSFLLQSLDEVSGMDARGRIVAALENFGVRIGRQALESGYIVDWKIVGPFPWDNENPMDSTFIGEPNVDPSKEIAWNGLKMDWKDYVSNDPNGMVDLVKIYGSLAASSVYALGTVHLSEDQDLLIKIGSNDGFKGWFNGEEFGRFDAGRTYAPDMDVFKVRGRKGENQVLLKIVQEGGRWAFGARVTDPSDAPLNLVSLD